MAAVLYFSRIVSKLTGPALAMISQTVAVCHATMSFSRSRARVSRTLRHTPQPVPTIASNTPTTALLSPIFAQTSSGGIFHRRLEHSREPAHALEHENALIFNFPTGLGARPSSQEFN